MTEAEWMGADNPAGRVMLKWLSGTRGPSGYYVRHLPISERKRRLFACACCRAAWHLLSDERSRRAVEAAERLAEGWGMAPVAELNAASLAVGNWAMDHDERVRAAKAAYYCLAEPTYSATVWQWLSRSVSGAAAASLLREVVGNPFRRQFEMASAVRHDPVPLAWLTPEVLAVARAGYDERLPAGALDPVRLAVLADALEDTGCAQEALLRHLRGWEQGGTCLDGVPLGVGESRRPLHVPHYRGCWALDLVLGLS